MTVRTPTGEELLPESQWIVADPDEILRLQGVPWMKRKIIASITITLYVKHYTDDEGKEHIDIKQIGTGGIGGSGCASCRVVCLFVDGFGRRLERRKVCLRRIHAPARQPAVRRGIFGIPEIFLT